MVKKDLMHWSLEIGILAVSIAAGLFLGGRVPDGIMPTSWRLPIGAFLVGLGIALVVIVFS